MAFCPNGANGILHDNKERILVVRQNYDERKWMLPGGGVEESLRETFRQAAIREILEETGIAVCDEQLTCAAVLAQKVKDYETGRIHDGSLHLFRVEGVFDLSTFTPNHEISEAAFMTVEEIVARKSEFKIGYVRMVIYYDRYRYVEQPVPIEGSLAERVEYSFATRT